MIHFHKGTQFSVNVVVVVANSVARSLKKEFAELQIRLYCVQNMSLEGSASKLDAGVVTALSPMIWRNSAELRAHFSYSFLSCQE